MTVFIDYGIEWETAWKNHVKKWLPPERPPNFVTVQEANKRMEPIMKSLISGDLRKTVQHPHIFLACQYYTHDEVDYEEDNEEDSENDPYADWKSWTDEKILEEFADDGEDFVYSELGYIDHAEYSHWPCSVLKEEDVDEERYTVRIHQSPLDSEVTATTVWKEKHWPRILTNYRRESIRYFIKPEDQDHMLPNVFRHHVGVPEGIFPEQWKNLKKQTVAVKQ